MNDWHTCAGRRPDPRVEPVLGIHVPRRHGLQPRLDQPPALSQRRRHDRHRSLRAHRPAVDHRARNLGDDGAVPVEGDRAALLRVPHARPRLRQYRRPADDLGHSLRLRRRPRHLRRAHRDHDRHRLCDLGRDGRPSSAPSRTTTATPPTCCASCATTAAPPMATGTATRSCRSTRCRWSPPTSSSRRWSRMPAPPGTAPSSSARSTATATRRRR